MISSAQGIALPSQGSFPPHEMRLAPLSCFEERHQPLALLEAPVCYVSGVGHFIPDNQVRNVPLNQQHLLDRGLDSTVNFNNWVFDRTGILARHFAEPTMSVITLAIEAAKDALRKSGIRINQVSHIIIGSTLLDASEESIISQIHSGLACPEGCIVLTEQKACASSIFCINTATSLLKSEHRSEHILIIGVDKGSSLIDFNDRNTAVLFGDGAGAMVLSRHQKIDSKSCPSGIYNRFLQSNTELSGLIFMGDDQKIVMPSGRDVFSQACNAMEKSIDAILAETTLTIGQIDRFLLHQANTRLPKHIAKKYSIPDDKVLSNIRYIGNTGAASPLILASEAVQNGHVRRGDITFMGAVGMGMHYGGALIVW